MNQLVKCVVVYTIINNKKNYVSSNTTRFDKKNLPSYSRSIHEAKPFATPGEATTFINNIHNPHDRTFDTEKATLPKASFSKQLEEGELVD